uniref:Uncharacterized protein n=1 Tax=Ditylenchus dipsaci TaxID=166011 RepID=A0A915DIC6_9BILA
MLEQTNHSIIARFVVDGLRDILSSGTMKNRLLLLVTDAARFMIKASCRTNKIPFPDVEKLISNVKKVFTKGPNQNFSV